MPFENEIYMNTINFLLIKMKPKNHCHFIICIIITLILINMYEKLFRDIL